MENNQSNLHLRNCKTVGISVWLGSVIGDVDRCCVINNAKYFDQFILLSDQEQGLEKYGVTCVTRSNMLELIMTSVPEALSKYITIEYYKPNYASDILTYFPFEVLNRIGVPNSIEAIMYLDTDYFVYSKFIIKELFSHMTYDHWMMFMKDANLYAFIPGDSYINAHWSLSVNNWCIFEKVKCFKDYFNSSFYKQGRYTCLGPGFTTTNYWKSFAKVAPIDYHTFDPRYSYEGENIVPIKEGAMGIHLVASMHKEVGLVLSSIYRERNNINILISKL